MAEKRFCFKRDREGHEYLIPTNLASQFEGWLNHIYSTELSRWNGEDFDDYMIDSIDSWSFELPEEDLES